MPNPKPIGVFDSGLGGLTVVRQLAQLMPNENIVYFGDTGRVPYGTRSAETIEKYAIEDEHFLLTKDVKMIVAACGTVSSVAAHTGENLPVPFLGVVQPAAKAAAEATKNNRIGVIGTSATIKSGAFDRVVRRYNPQAQVFSNPCPLLVPLVEAGWIGRDDIVTVTTAKRYLAPLLAQGIDTLILGCTHYPVLTEIIRDIMGEDTVLIHPGEWAAAAVRAELAQRDALNSSKTAGMHTFFVSDRTASFSATASILLGYDIEKSVQYIDLKEFAAYAGSNGKY